MLFYYYFGAIFIAIDTRSLIIDRQDNMSKEFDQEFTEFIVKAIVNHPDDVRAERTVDERGVLITLHINPEDMGYVVGRQGQTARAIRTLLKKIGARENARVNLKIYEPEGSRQQHFENKAAAASAGVASPAPVVADDTDTSEVDDLTF
ncbi:MAG: hypothetical protein UU40_C0001G0027 [Candidatus Uhrbacteria bacterium GW2011_GWD2_41_121]|uniref:RNA-binding protein KhpA n=1 Tax=Candidatus Uhrbacteria bacterium GW2011_GWC1_41_20 TaxID=1618983 RepID=A0A0G0XSP7_9BACT|nr:MAG: hypothetical protein UT52_C0001G0043 [Candidatus Uhrbacteria bacterium GW2011_GWE1_39_46]KKR64432.1 MAG: hypothetical protein UU04_C0002G0043 [Candidatus Uhrbacteria bacterium GW2011_GWC2_40_450]KKR90689.1 MAG: hypothetical protein UU40_C0001G0027 [Candidatus Uhrbacteria bacterium GW2011_GWD2_41_121]KKR96594.1 MAG: hypothetical protein UU46_C0001G0043 [Candidatus Uhrbacteria bacterium GW2011_GWD1_41_16]KKR99985.1 MAG: hypothetical protein UU50_C0001G0043 [Candidatus Uhrbacteria bacteriu